MASPATFGTTCEEAIIRHGQYVHSQRLMGTANKLWMMQHVAFTHVFAHDAH